MLKRVVEGGMTFNGGGNSSHSLRIRGLETLRVLSRARGDNARLRVVDDCGQLWELDGVLLLIHIGTERSAWSCWRW